jgi:hypothetical protein
MNMHKILPALHSRLSRCFFIKKFSRPARAVFSLLFLFAFAGTVPADEWFRSNAAGMALEKLGSRTSAMRNTYALLVETPPVREIPPYLTPYYSPVYGLERRTLYEKGSGLRQQWLFIDSRGKNRVVSAFSLSAGESGAKGGTDFPFGVSALIELYGEDGLISEEHLISAEGDDYLTRYIYNKGVLIRAETRLKRKPEDAKALEEPATLPVASTPTTPAAESLGAERENTGVGQSPAETDSAPADLEESAPPERTENTDRRMNDWVDILTDYYRYTRSASLRAVERVYHQDRAEDDYLVRIRFPFLSPDIQPPEGFIKPGSASVQADLAEPADSSGPVQGAAAAKPEPVKAGSRVRYTTDSRGRVLTETYEDENGRIREEVKNTWSLDRLLTVLRKIGEDEERTEYSYNADGDRILERNYKNGIMTREVRREGGREVEVLYMNGRPILRAVWEDGRKVSEEPIRPGAEDKNR